MYQTGRGVEPDVKRALEWYTLAVEQGDAQAQYLLGIMYQTGQGVEPDAKRAVELYTLARHFVIAVVVNVRHTVPHSPDKRC